MARKKTCFASSVCCSDAFANLSFPAQALYYRLGFEADADGALVNARQISRLLGVGADALAELVENGFLIELPPIHVIADWWVNNNRDSCNYREGDHHALIYDALCLNGGRRYCLVREPNSDSGLQSVCNQSDCSLQYNGNERDGMEENAKEVNHKEPNENESAPPSLYARCPQCGMVVLAYKNPDGSIQGFCKQDGDFCIPAEEWRAE